MKIRYSLLLLFVLSASFPALSQTILNRDPQIADLVGQVSADSLRAHIDGLVSFGTRNTLSTTTDSKQGIGAARRWVLGKFNQYAKRSNGRLTATIDTWTLPADGRRVDVPTEMGNVIATLKGTDPTDNRIFLVQGHIDTRVTNVMNRTAVAPGANDDGSGTAAVIELCRVMSQAGFPATIVFAVVSGEEQGLLGAEHLAEQYVQQKVNMEALLNNDIMGSNHSNETNIRDNTRLRVFSEGLPGNLMKDTTGRIAQIRQFGNENDGKARTLARYVKELGERYVDNLEVVLIYRNDRYLRGGDHTPFVQRGFAAVRLTEMNENYDHQHQDLRTEKGTRVRRLRQIHGLRLPQKEHGRQPRYISQFSKGPSHAAGRHHRRQEPDQFDGPVLESPGIGQGEGLLRADARNELAVLAEEVLHHQTWHDPVVF